MMQNCNKIIQKYKIRLLYLIKLDKLLLIYYYEFLHFLIIS